MKVSVQVLKLVIIQYLEEDNEPMSEAKIIVLPCTDMETAKEFEVFYRKKFPPTQLQNITIVDSPIYG